MTKTHSQDVVLFAPMGSNPALLVAMAWALERQHGLRVAEAYLVLADKGARYMDTELLPRKKGLDALHEVMGPGCLPREHLHVRTATLPDGTVVKDELSGADAEAYQDKVVDVAKEAIESAGDRPVVFALLAGRRRTMTVMASIVAQFFARSEDRVMDLRIEPRGADVPNCFFFPEQRDTRAFEVDGEYRLPSEVQVSLVDVQVPRLHALLFSGEKPSGYQDLLRLGQECVDRAGHPLSLEVRLCEDKSKRGAFVHDPLHDESIAIDLTGPQLLYLASLIEGREDSEDGFVQVGNALSTESAFARLVRSVPWAKRYKVAHAFLGTELEGDEVQAMDRYLDELRSRTRKALDDAAEGRDVGYEQLQLKRETRGGESFWALRLRNARVVK